MLSVIEIAAVLLIIIIIIIMVRRIGNQNAVSLIDVINVEMKIKNVKKRKKRGENKK